MYTPKVLLHSCPSKRGSLHSSSVMLLSTNRPFVFGDAKLFLYVVAKY